MRIWGRGSQREGVGVGEGEGERERENYGCIDTQRVGDEETLNSKQRSVQLNFFLSQKNREVIYLFQALKINDHYNNFDLNTTKVQCNSS